MNTTSVKTLVVDAMNLAFRSFYTMPRNFSSSSGDSTGVIYGFLNSLQTVYRKYQPGNLIIVWDSPYNIRKDMDADYKVREKDPEIEQLTKQVISLKNDLPSVGIPCIELYGYEADDIMALLAYRKELRPMMVVTNDSDCYQFLYKGVTIDSKGNLLDLDFLKETYGIDHPVLFTIFKSLTGCRTDKVKGVSGIAEIKAKSLLSSCHYDIDEIYAEIDRLGYTEEFNKALALIAIPLGYDFSIELEINPLKIERRKLEELFLKYDIYSINPNDFLQGG